MIEYKLTVQGGEWTAEPFGWHATADLVRWSQQAKDEISASGLAYLSAHGQGFAAPSASFAPGSSQPLEFYGYPHRSLGPEDIGLLEQRDNFSLSGFVGVMKLYDVMIGSSEYEDTHESADTTEASIGLISIAVGDGCVDFSTMLAFEYSENIVTTASAILEELQSEVEISRTNLGSPRHFE